MNGFLFHPEAEDDLNEIWAIYCRGQSGRGGPGARGDLRVHTFSRSDSRPGAPPARLNSPVALWRVREYLIAYAPEEQPLLVIAILHGRRSPRVMAAILRGR